ncbi:hypothetical protein EDD11_005570 [Mortierella claussenii]|nr:hypothetical protein EDD11_005570 [Mortierella claussenii]
MFSSFKERLNTSLSTRHEKGLPTTASTPPAISTTIAEGVQLQQDEHSTTTTAGGTGAGIGAGSIPPSLNPPHTPIPSQGSFGPLASRISSSISASAPSALFFRRPLQGATATATVNTAIHARSSADLVSARSSSSSSLSFGGTGMGLVAGKNTKLALLVQKLTLDPREESPDLVMMDKIREQYRKQQNQSQDLKEEADDEKTKEKKEGEKKQEQEHEQERQELQELGTELEPAGTELSDAVVEKLEILQRYEARFPDLAEAFRTIVQEKVAAEAVLKATTRSAVEDLGDLEALEAHMQNMAHKNEMSMVEIKRLSEELRETSRTKEQELASKAALIQDLQDQLATQRQELKHLRSKDITLEEFSDSTSLCQDDRQVETASVDSATLPIENIVLSSSPPSPDPQQISSPPTSTTTTPLHSAKKTASREAKKNKDQALRELMNRLEAVLREKNEAKEEQEEALEEQQRLKKELEKQALLNKEMSDKVSQLQVTIAGMKEQARVHRGVTDDNVAALADIDAGSVSGVNPALTATTTTTSETSDQVPPSSVQDQLSTLQHNLDAALARESEVLLSKTLLESALARLQDSYTALQESIVRTQKSLDSANAHISELQDLATVLGETKQELVEAQEDVKEKERLLDLERQWREEAQETREKLKREQQELKMRTDFLQRELGTLKDEKKEVQGILEEVRRELEDVRENKEILESKTVEANQSNGDSGASNGEEQSQGSTLEQLDSLKQERAELSEKLARLERLHQGFERSSSERIQALEQELNLLIKQKVALEAQVQEQSDLLIKEKKEKEKEMEQARVAEGIERVTLELAAVKTAERFASEKVTELAKDRDRVVAEVVKLERRLEQLKECQCGQEQSLTVQVEELERQKKELEGLLEVARKELEEMKEQSEEDRNQWREKNEALIRKLEKLTVNPQQLEAEQTVKAEATTAATIATINGNTDAAATTTESMQELEQKLKSLNAELQANTKKFEIAQGQVQVQRTLHADKIQHLQDQIQVLTTERDILLQPKLELEQRLLECQEEIKRLEQGLQAMKEENEKLLKAKADLEEEMQKMQTRVRVQGQKEQEQVEALKLAKETINQRDQELSATQKLLKQAESNLAKTVQKMSRLEKEKLKLMDQVEDVKGSLTKLQQEKKATVTKLTNDQAASSQELQRIKATHVKVLQERDQAVQERDALTQEKGSFERDMQVKRTELENVQQMRDSFEKQLRECQEQLSEARNRMDTLEELTSIAKRVAESKVKELEVLNSRSEAMEDELKDNKLRMDKMRDEYRETVSRLEAGVDETREILGEVISEMTEEKEKLSEENKTLKRQDEEKRAGCLGLEERLEEATRTARRLETEMQELRSAKRDLELELQHFKDLEPILAKDRATREATTEEFKMRENHLRTLNKNLKEEIRKLQKYIPGSSFPSPTTPPSQYSQGNPPVRPEEPRQLHNGGIQAILATPRPKASSSSAVGRAFSTPMMNSTPPATPRYQRSSDGKDEDVNVEYLKNVMLNFMEHKERRQQLIPVVAQILRLSSEETKRFAKVV